MGKDREKSKSSLLVTIAICLFFLISWYSSAEAQVVIVQTPQRPSKSTPKTSGKAKTRSQTKPTSGVSVNLNDRPRASRGPVAAAGSVDSSSLGFPIMKPPMADVSLGLAEQKSPTAKGVPGFPIMKPPMGDVAATNNTTPAAPSGQILASDSKVVENGATTNNASEAKIANSASPVIPETTVPKVENKTENIAEAKPVETKEPAGKPAEKVAVSAKLERLFDYGFDVITSDARGKIASVGKDIRRYFNEELAGGVSLEMVEITGGSFMMGSSTSEINQNEKAYSRDLSKRLREKVEERLPSEIPMHVVKVPTYYIGKFEVTQSQWRAIASLPKVKRDLMSDPSEFKGGNRPVERISWEEAVEFCERLSRATGRKYRLPSESEWEYACRAGTETQFHFGPAVAAEWANFDGKRPFLASSGGESRQQTVVAGSLGGANAFGLYDMHGNVWEWCLD